MRTAVVPDAIDHDPSMLDEAGQTSDPTVPGGPAGQDRR